MTARRRDVLVIGGITEPVCGLRSLPWDRLTGRGPVCAEISERPPFRRLAIQGPMSGTSAALVGLESLSAAAVRPDTGRLTRDIASSEVQADLDRTRALADVFGFVATPGLVIGLTVLNGSIPCAVLPQIAEDEKSMAEAVC